MKKVEFAGQGTPQSETSILYSFLDDKNVSIKEQIKAQESDSRTLIETYIPLPTAQTIKEQIEALYPGGFVGSLFAFFKMLAHIARLRIGAMAVKILEPAGYVLAWLDLVVRRRRKDPVAVDLDRLFSVPSCAGCSL